MFIGQETYDLPHVVVAKCGITFNVQEPRAQSEDMVRLSSAPAPVRSPVLEGGNLTATICVASAYALSLPEGVVNVGTWFGCTIARLTMNVAYILMGDDKSLCLQSVGLQFTFHCDIAEEAMALLDQAHKEASEREGQLVIQQRLAECAQKAEEDAARCRAVVKETAPPMPYYTFNERGVVSPVPERDGGVTTHIWTDEDVMTVPPSSVQSLSREEEANAFSGALENVGFRKNQNPTKAQKKEATRLAKLTEALRQELEARCQTKLDAAREKDFREESIRIKLEDRRRMEEEEREQKRLESLRMEYGAIQSFILTHLSITLEQFLAKPGECRAIIGEFQNHAVPAQEEEAHGHEQYVTIHTPHLNHINGLCKQAAVLDIYIDVYQSGTHWCANLSANDMQHMIASKRQQYICLSAMHGGYSVQVSAQSYDALMQIRPDTATLVYEAQAMQEQYSHKAYAFTTVPTMASPLVIVPVLDIYGRVLGFQQVPQYA